MVAAGAGSFLKGAGSLSLPLSSISGAGASIGLFCAWVVQYTPYSVICRGRCFTGPDGAPGRRALHGNTPTRRVRSPGCAAVGADLCVRPRGDGDIAPYTTHSGVYIVRRGR